VTGDPYRGLSAYEDTPEDARVFFGRAREQRLAIASLLGARTTVLHGPSGVGKSSLLRAGVVHALRRQSLKDAANGGARYAVVLVREWHGDPLARLAAATRLAVDELTGDSDEGFEGTDLRRLLTRSANRFGGTVLVVFDQFDEYLLQRASSPESSAFLRDLASAMRDRHVPATFLLSVREDALAELSELDEEVDGLLQHRLRVEHLGREAATEAIEKPLEHVGYSIEPELTAAVLEDVRTGNAGFVERGGAGGDGRRYQAEAPFLQLVMTRIWDAEHGRSRVLRLETYDSLGRAKKLVGQHVSASMSGLPGRDQKLGAALFYQLVTPSGTKIALPEGDLAERTRSSLGDVHRVV
jgi:Novel STAND NTPase 1